MDHEMRRRMHCGYLDKSEWVGEKPQFDRPFVGDPLNESRRVDISGLNVCPGWAVRLPAVAQASQAYAALEKGCLETYFPGRENTVLEGAMALMRGANKHTELVMSKLKDKK